MKNIFLIGMMGSGKSTIGKLLSKKLSMPIIDMDDELEQLMDMSITKIFDEYGENRFRLIESTYFRECSKNDDFIYSTGGGIILDANNQNILKTRGMCFFLDCNTTILINRLGNQNKNRPLYKNDNDIIALYNSRKNLYKKCAHYTIDTSNLTKEETLIKIEKLYNENN